MLTPTLAALLLLGDPSAASRDPHAPTAEARVAVDSSEVVLTVAPLHIPAGTHYHDHGMPDARAQLVWPSTGWIQGYRVDLFDAEGRLLPREMIHHAGVVNPGSRQLAYDDAERILAVGSETDPVSLPDWMGLPMSEGTPLVVYFALVNSTEHPVEGASLRITVRWRSANAPPHPSALRPYPRRYHPMQRVRHETSDITEVRPFVVGAGPGVGGSGAFDVPPGRSERHADFTLDVGGRLRALGGHLHDYAQEVRIEDVETGRVLVRLRAYTDADGRLERVEETYFITRPGGLRLEAGRRYRVVAVYDNPTGRTIPHGAMAYMAGPFAPEE